MTKFLTRWVCAGIVKLLRSLLPFHMCGVRCLNASYQSPKFSLAVFMVSLPWLPQAISLCTPKEGLGQDDKGFWLVLDGLTSWAQQVPHHQSSRATVCCPPAGGVCLEGTLHLGTWVSPKCLPVHLLPVLCDEGFAAALGAC